MACYSSQVLHVPRRFHWLSCQISFGIAILWWEQHGHFILVGMHMVASHHCFNRRSPRPVYSLYFCEVGQLSVMHCLLLALELTEEDKHPLGAVRLSKVLKFFSNRGHLQVECPLIQFQPVCPQKLHHMNFSYYSLASCSAWMWISSLWSTFTWPLPACNLFGISCASPSNTFSPHHTLHTLPPQRE